MTLQMETRWVPGILISLSVLIGCGGHVTETAVAGSWTLTENSQSQLPLDAHNAKLILRRDGTFVSDNVPSELLYFLPGMHHVPTVSGTGTWKLGEASGNPAIWLTFRAIPGPTEYKVPNDTPLWINDQGSGVTLYFFLDDPDEGNRIEFEKRN